MKRTRYSVAQAVAQLVINWVNHRNTIFQWIGLILLWKQKGANEWTRDQMKWRSGDLCRRWIVMVQSKGGERNPLHHMTTHAWSKHWKQRHSKNHQQNDCGFVCFAVPSPPSSTFCSFIANSRCISFSYIKFTMFKSVVALALVASAAAFAPAGRYDLVSSMMVLRKMGHEELFYTWTILTSHDSLPPPFSISKIKTIGNAIQLKQSILHPNNQ